MNEVVVIGGGPAGSSAAIRLARTGRRVTLYEKSHFPRAKLCGGFLSPECLEELDELNVLEALRSRGAVPLHRTVVASCRGSVIESALPAEALSVSRQVLDHLLMDEAGRSGVQIRQGTTAPDETDERRIIIVASGRKPLGRPATSYFGIQALFRNVSGVTDQVELDLIESGYVGLARQPEGINVCALTTKDAMERWGPDLDKVMAHFAQENPLLRSHLSGAERIGPWLSVGPVQLGVRQLAHDTTFYVGDAACVVDPFAGEGVAMGLYSSRLLVGALGQNKIPEDRAYAALWKEAFMPSLRWNALMRALYSLGLFREPALAALKWFPRGINWLTDLTRYRRIETV